MMNYIWAGLILVSIVFAIGYDINDELSDTYENDRIHDLEIIQPDPSMSSRRGDIQFNLIHYNVVVSGRYQISGDNAQIIVRRSDLLPKSWKYRFKNDDDNELVADVVDSKANLVRVRLSPVHWRRLENMMQSAFDMAEFAARLALGLVGLMALWLGLMKIAEESGLVSRLVRMVKPVLKPLFPEVPPDHPAMGAISLNLAANILGLGNAATPMGIKAMQHLQELNQEKDTASNSMCMFLALNTSSVQLLPPVTVIALLGVNAGGLFVSIFLATLCSTLVGVFAARWYARKSSCETVS